MATVSAVTIDTQDNAAGTSAIRWRLVVASVLMMVSLVAAVVLSGMPVPVDDADGIRGAVQWMISRWGWWFGSPILWWVAALAAVGVGTSCFAAFGRGGRAAWGVLLSSSIALLGVGVWYILGVASIANPEFLRGPWYLAALAGGSLAAIVLLASLPTRRILTRLNVPTAPGGVTLSNRFVLGSAAGGLALTAVVLAGPFLGSPPREASELAIYWQLRRTQMLHGREGGERLLLPVGGKTILRLGGTPTLGPVDAPNVIYHFFDYTEVRSRACHLALREARNRYGDQIVVLALVWPLDAKINPHVAPDVAAQHPHAGEYARLALAVWLADPKQFEAFHEYLLTPGHDEQVGLVPTRTSMPSVQEARAAAEAMVGAEALQRALADPALDTQIRRHIGARSPVQSTASKDQLAPETAWLRFNEQDGIYEARGVIGPMASTWLFEDLENYWGIKPVHTEVAQDDAIMELLN